MKIKLLVDRATNLFQKKKPEPKFKSPLYAQRPVVVQRSLGSHSIAFLLPFIHECGVVVWGDVKWLVTRGRQNSTDAWAEAVERMQRDTK